MITEDYVSFEVAKLLKEKGFDGDCRARYDYNGSLYYEKYPIESAGAEMHNSILCPTLQMAMKWLREIHNLHCDIGYDDLGWFWDILSVDDTVPVEDRPKMLNNVFAGSNSYEEACEESIRYCLENLI